MNRDLERLRAWAADKANTDTDQNARTRWAQIRDEVTNYLEPEPGPADYDTPLWEGPAA